jgi:sporulation protein YlmC with PRC-barrel domain
MPDAKETEMQDKRDTSGRMRSAMTGTDIGEGKQIRRVLSASSLNGDRVRNSGGEDLGTLKEIMIDLESGRIAYGVLSVGGFLGMGDKLFAIPWSSFKVDEYNKELILSVDKETLKNAPGFDKDNWPDFADPSMGEQIYSHYGQRPYWDDSSSYGSYGSETGETRTRDTTGLHGDPSRDRSKF